MPIVKPWVLVLSSTLQEPEGLLPQSDYLNSLKFLVDWQRLHEEGKVPWGARILSTYHPLKGNKAELSKPRQDVLLSVASGLDCYRSSYKGLAAHLVHATTNNGARLSEYLSQTFNATGIESLSWEASPNTRQMVFNSYSLFTAGKPLIENGACAGIYVQHPSEYDAACRLSVESGTPLFANFSAQAITAAMGGINSGLESAQASNAIARGWFTRVNSLLKNASGLVFPDANSLLRASDVGRLSWDESRASDYSCIWAAVQMLSDHKSAVATAKWGELAIDDRRKAVGLAKSIEDALKQASVSYDSFSLYSKHFCLCQQPLDLVPLEQSTLNGIDAHTISGIRQKLLCQPSLDGSVIGRHTKLVYCQAADSAGLKRFLHAFKELPLTAGLLLDSSDADGEIDVLGALKESGMSHRTVVLSNTSPTDRARMQSSVDLVVIPSEGKIRVESFLVPLCACSVARKLSSKWPPVILTSGQVPHFLADLNVFPHDLAQDASYAKAITKSLEDSKTRFRLESSLLAIISGIQNHKNSAQTAVAVCSFFKSSATGRIQ